MKWNEQKQTSLAGSVRGTGPWGQWKWPGIGQYWILPERALEDPKDPKVRVNIKEVLDQAILSDFS